MKNDTEKYMLRALELAERGIGQVEPNPLVGCVIVKEGRIIGEGWHAKFGQAHAEVNAIADCRQRGEKPAGAVMFVTLEPCCHTGKTGPCTEAIIEAGIKKVIAAMEDPNEHGSGKGFAQLRQAGIEVEVGLCESQARRQNAAFIKFAKTGRSWVTLKWAQSIDGKVAAGSGQRWITGVKAREDVHRLRRKVGAILIGINTVVVDDPLLTARPSGRRKLLRVVLDSRLRIAPKCKLIQTAKDEPLIIFTTAQAMASEKEKLEKLNQLGVDIVEAGNGSGRCDIPKVISELGRRNIEQVLIEGGPEVIASFLREGIADEAVVYIAPKIIGGRAAGMSRAFETLAEQVTLNFSQVQQFEEDLRISGLLPAGMAVINSKSPNTKF